MQNNARAFSGFTVIEFIMLMVILSVLSAYAFPRFADMSSQAETTVIEGALTSARASAGIAHAHWLAAGRPESVTIEGLEIVTRNGYPTADLSHNIQSDDAQNTQAGLIAQYDNTICGLAGLSALDYQCQTDPKDPNTVHVAVLTAVQGSACFRYQVPNTPDGRPVFSRVLQDHKVHQLAAQQQVTEGWQPANNTCQG
jgi:MSHA pilin protein MshA